MAALVFKRVHDYVRWLPFLFIVGLVLYAYVVIHQVHIFYTLSRRHEYLSSILNIIVTNVLCGMTLWCFLVAVFKHPGSPLGAQKDVAEEGQGSSTRSGETRWSKGERARASELHEDDEGDEEGHNSDDEAPLLVSGSRDRSMREDPTTSAFDGGANALPGQPRVPSRTERAQLDDVVSVVERLRGESQASGSSKVFLGGLQVKNTGGKRWCNKCDCEKPDRAHHCSACGVCILRMDHHCPWLASNCVGLRNHKAFFLFLCYTALLCSFAAQDMGRVLVRYVEEETNGFETSPISWAILLFIGFIFGLALIPFAGYHAYLICRNRTTLESMEGAGRVRVSVPRPSSAPPRDNVSDRLRRIAGSNLPAQASSSDDGWKRDEQLSREERSALKKANKLNIYDVGVGENWRAVMGTDWTGWFVPVGEPESDGYSFHINTTSLQRLEEVTTSIRSGSDRERRGPGGGEAARLTNGSSELPRRKVTAPVFSSPVSSVRGKSRMTQGEVAKGESSSPPSHRSQGSNYRNSGHGIVEWGAPPKKDFVLYGVRDDDVDSGGVLQDLPSTDHSKAFAQARALEQMDSDVWS